MAVSWAVLGAVEADWEDLGFFSLLSLGGGLGGVVEDIVIDEDWIQWLCDLQGSW